MNYARVAQLVERGIENPCVGGSSPPSGTIMLLLLISCTLNECHSLCGEVADALQECIQEWPVEWDDLGYSSRNDYFEVCKQQWNETQNSLNQSQENLALTQCENTLESLQTEPLDCDYLRAQASDLQTLTEH